MCGWAVYSFLFSIIFNDSVSFLIVKSIFQEISNDESSEDETLWNDVGLNKEKQMKRKSKVCLFDGFRSICRFCRWDEFTAIKRRILSKGEDRYEKMEICFFGYLCTLILISYCRRTMWRKWLRNLSLQKEENENIMLRSRTLQNERSW